MSRRTGGLNTANSTVIGDAPGMDFIPSHVQGIMTLSIPESAVPNNVINLGIKFSHNPDASGLIYM